MSNKQNDIWNENMEEVTSEINSIIKRSFKLISEKIVVEYVEI